MNINQIKANPNNPRILKDFKFKMLVESIKSFPEMLELRPIIVDENNIIIGGNQRHKACLELGMTEVPVKIALGLTEEQKKEFIIRDNISFGEWSMDQLANDWDINLLDNWGLELPIFDNEQKDNTKGEQKCPNCGVSL